MRPVTKVVPKDLLRCSRCTYSPTGCVACNPERTMKGFAKKEAKEATEAATTATATSSSDPPTTETMQEEDKEAEA